MMSMAELSFGGKQRAKQAASRQGAEMRADVSDADKTPAFRRLSLHSATQGGDNPAAAVRLGKRPAPRQIGLYRF